MALTIVDFRFWISDLPGWTSGRTKDQQLLIAQIGNR